MNPLLSCNISSLISHYHYFIYQPYLLYQLIYILIFYLLMKNFCLNSMNSHMVKINHFVDYTQTLMNCYYLPSYLYYHHLITRNYYYLLLIHFELYLHSN